MISSIKVLFNNNLYYLGIFCKTKSFLLLKDLFEEIINIEFRVNRTFFRLLILNNLKNIFFKLIKISFNEVNNSNIDNSDSICQICMDDQKKSEMIKVCYNNHFYHKECITQWLESSSIHVRSCPTCRQIIKLSLIKNFYICFFLTFSFFWIIFTSYTFSSNFIFFQNSIY